jgi:AcrR family transcriptional regulator
MSRSAPTRRKRGELTRDGLVSAALEVIDTGGLDGLTMRRLAQRVGCGTMTVYGHIWDRDDLLKAVVERLLGEIDFHYEPGDTWADVLRRAAETYFAMVQRHPGAYSLIAYTPPDQPPTSTHLARATEALCRTGIPMERAIALMAIADAFATGFFINQVEYLSRGARSDEAPLTDAALQTLGAVDGAEAWRQGTETIVAGVQKTLGMPAVPAAPAEAGRKD